MPQGVFRFPELHRLNVALSKMGDKNPRWKGDDVSYIGLHVWVRRNLLKPDSCEMCKNKVDDLDLANISGKYLRKLDDWEWLCRKCHMKSDGRLKRLIIRNKKTIITERDKSGRITKCCQA